MVFEDALMRKLFTVMKNGNFLVVCSYSHDLIFTGNDITLREQLKKLLMNEFEMTYMGLLHYFFGIEVKPTNEEIVISQQKYAKELLNEFRTVKATPFITPIEVSLKLSKNDRSEEINGTLYGSLVRSCI